MSNPRRSSGARAKSPVQPRANAQATGNGKSRERKDHYNNDKKHKATESAMDKRRESGSRQTKRQTDKCESQDQPAASASDTKPAPRRANSNRQSKKQKELSNSDREEETSQTSESKSENERATEYGRARKSAAVSVSKARAPGNDARTSDKQSKTHINQPECDRQEQPDTGKSDTIRNTKSAIDKCSGSRQSKRQTDKCESQDKPAASASDTRPAPRRANSRKQKDLFSHDRDVTSPKLSSNESRAKRRGKLTKAQNSNSTDNTDDVATPHPSLDNELNKVLNATIEKLKIKKRERSNASSCVNEITEKVISHLKQKMTWCADIECLTTGSYYENVKICEPDEFDVMLTVPVGRVDIQKFKDNEAFYSVSLKRHPNKHPLARFLNEDKTIKASEMLNDFRDVIKEAVDTLSYKIEVQRKKQKCPAVTLQVTENGKAISIDFVLGLKVHGSWPIYTQDGFKIEDWLGTKEKTDLKRQPYYLVPKYEGRGNAEHDGVVAKNAWRISFSHIEKEILKRHGHSKTCCESRGQKCCRKECLKLLKYLLGQLKLQHPEKMSKFCSYHAKTTLLHACATRVQDSDWAYSQMADCFQQLLDNFIRSLRNQDLRNFFVPSHNLLHQDYVPKSSCEFLAKEIEIQRNNFPIF